MRPYRFPSLGKVKTLNGKVLDKHRYIPTDDMEQLMSDYVDSMDLSTYCTDEDGYRRALPITGVYADGLPRKPAEYAPVEETFSPIIHRINQVIKHRAIHTDEPLPPPYDVLTKFSHPPKDLLEKSQAQLEKLIEACDVKKRTHLPSTYVSGEF